MVSKEKVEPVVVVKLSAEDVYGVITRMPTHESGGFRGIVITQDDLEHIGECLGDVLMEYFWSGLEDIMIELKDAGQWPI